MCSKRKAISQFGSGYIPRDFAATPPARSRSTPADLRREELIERIKEKEARKSGLADLHRALKDSVLDQGQFGLLLDVRYGQMHDDGLRAKWPACPVPFSCFGRGQRQELSQSRRPRRRSFALHQSVWCIDNEVLADGAWPIAVTIRPSNALTPRYTRPLSMRIAIEQPASVASALVLDLPCTGGFAWWGHLIALLQPRIVTSGIGIEFVK